MGTTSALPGAQDALFAKLKARSGLNGILVSLGWPFQPQESSYVVISGDVDNWAIEDLTTGVVPRTRRETFVLVVECRALYSSEDYPTTRNVCVALKSEVEQAVRGDPKLSNSVDDSEITVGSIKEIREDDGRGRGVRIELHVACSATLEG